ncbi:MAG TPA: C40 family peptidase [Gaiellaceae bacterium]|jgi:cell wall-associated NlpC family hydrolase
MRTPRLLILVLAVALALAVSLVWPVVSRAGGGEPQGPSLDPLPVPAPADSTLPLLRTPAAVRKHLRTKRETPVLGNRIVGFAKHLIGVPYSWGGSSPRTGFDCSGFVRYVYGHFGVSLAHSSFSDFVRGRRVGRWAMKPGDLVFFDGAGHVGIYVGHGRFIHAPHTGTVVRISTMAGWYSSRFDGARRVVAGA